MQVAHESADTVSVLLEGRALDRLAVSGGQFFYWRFLAPGLWSTAHPFSLSALPSPPYLRITVKVTGEHTARIAKLKPGTRVAIAGPYGALTTHARSVPKAALIAAGIGVTPLRALIVIPDISRREVFICGPESFAAQTARAVRRSGVPRARVHVEAFCG